MGYLRPYNTQSHIWVGPFLDETDGVSPETTLVVASMDIDLHRVDGIVSITATSNAVTHNSSPICAR